MNNSNPDQIFLGIKFEGLKPWLNVKGSKKWQITALNEVVRLKQDILWGNYFSKMIQTSSIIKLYWKSSVSNGKISKNYKIMSLYGLIRKK